MIRDHVDFLVAFAVEEFEAYGLDMLDVFYNPYVWKRNIHVWCEFRRNGVILGYDNIQTLLQFPLSEDLLHLTLLELESEYDEGIITS